MSPLTPTGTILTKEMIQDYRLHGYVIVRQVFAQAEIWEALEEAERLVQRRDLIASENLRCRWQPHVKTQECLFECFDPIIDISPVCARLARNDRLLHILGELYGEEACLFKDKLIFKPPGAKGYDLHQDFIAWPDFPRSFVTAVIALDRTDLDNGCTVVYPGYHLQGCLTPEDGDYHPLSAGLVDEAKAVPLILDPGDVAIFGCFTPHGSAPNLSENWRRQLYLSYDAISDGGEQREKHYQEFHVWLRKKYAEYGKHFVYFL
ncbi:MAG TPA: phytanoyl-CoA dioxygenase family protein [Gemmataceae bacterium]|nr:phytanoyl-CoA dioxygenase family protein [Gemmataceae bacterium]